MSVLQMQRINLCALKKNRKAILERLQETGAVEVDIRLEDDSGYACEDVTSLRMTFEKNVRTADRALEVLQQYVPEKKGMLDSLAGKPLVDKDSFEKVVSCKESYLQKAETVIELDKQIMAQRANIQRLQNQIESMIPWQGLSVPLNYSGTRKTSVFIGTLPGVRSLESVYGIFAKDDSDTEAVDAEIVFQDKDFTYLAVICLKKDAQKVEEALRTAGFARPAQMSDKMPGECSEDFRREIEISKSEIERLQKEIEQLAPERQNFKWLSDYFRMRADKYEVLGKLPQTKNTFVLSGYIPAVDGQKIKDELSQKYEAVVELEDIQEEEEAPVLLKNNHFAQAGEGVLASFGLPAKGEIDPTCIMTVFYVFLFGLMLSDAAYGLIVALACGFLLKKYPRMEENMRKSIRLFFFCGLSTLFWGIMFGGYFGDAVNVISRTFFGHEVSIPALWFVPLNEPMRMLLWSVIFGLIHMYTGLAIKAYMCIRDHRYADALCDVGFWFLLLTGLVLMLIPSSIFASMFQIEVVFPEVVNTLSKAMAVIGAVGIVLMSGRAKKNKWGLRIALGAYDLYNITGWLSDALSYSRLLALGLATGVIASVFNQMGSMLGGGIVGAVIFIIVFLIGHTFNLAINLLGAYVHTCRLQYVEFFGKFYEGGGKAFHPFRSNTKYVDIKEETRA